MKFGGHITYIRFVRTALLNDTKHKAGNNQKFYLFSNQRRNNRKSLPKTTKTIFAFIFQLKEDFSMIRKNKTKAYLFFLLVF